MSATSTAKRRRRQAKLRNGRKVDKFDARAAQLALNKRRGK